MINGYLKNTQELDDHVLHLLFSANRWEHVASIESRLAAGETIICDRYAYSGVAFSAAKGMDIAWCKAPDAQLPKPDLVIMLDLPMDIASQRGEFGEVASPPSASVIFARLAPPTLCFGQERYEKVEFQQKVQAVFKKLRQPYWQVVQACRCARLCM